MKSIHKLISPIFHFHSGHKFCGGTLRKLPLRCAPFSSSSQDRQTPSVSDVLRTRIEISGPITVADYMRAVLTIPGSGYYMHRDVFGKEGDFVTSPEISQLFGEMIGVWFVNELRKIGMPKPWQLIELGPGRGMMMKDIQRVFSSLKATEGLSLHLVEISPELSKIQAKNLCQDATVEHFEENLFRKKQLKKGRSRTDQIQSKDNAQNQSEDKAKSRETTGISTVTVRRPPGVDRDDGSDARNFYYMKGITHEGLPVFWYRSLLDVPRDFSCIIAHEFFDALPVHKFQRTKEGWREVLIAPNAEAGKEHFKYVLARSETPASKFLMKDEDAGDHAEVCLEAAMIMRQLGQRIEEDGGIALIADYGHEGAKTDTFRAFRKHEQTDPLVNPGSADLTADVDFEYLKNSIGNNVLTFGPVSQSDFLRNMGIETRLKILMDNCEEKQRAQLKSGCDMITSPDQMGSRFKFISLFPGVLKNLLEHSPVAGFSESKSSKE